MIKFTDNIYVTLDGEIVNENGVKRNESMSNGYKYISVYDKKKKKNVNYRSNRIIAHCLIGEIPPKMVVNHIDGDKLNNHVSNLEIITSRENNLHAFKASLKKNKSIAGIKQPKKDCHYWKTIELYLSDRSIQSISRELGTGHATVSRMVYGIRYKKEFFCLMLALTGYDYLIKGKKCE